MVKTHSKIIISISIVLVLFSIAVLTTGCSNSNATGLTEQITSSDFYKSLTAEEKAAFDEGFNKLTSSYYYKNWLSDEEKKEVVEKYVESEKVQKEIKNDEPDVDPDSIVIPEDATEEEKAKLEQEKAYWEAVTTVKEAMTNEETGIFGRSNFTPRKILGIYSKDSRLTSTIYIQVQMLNVQNIAGVEFYSLSTEIIRIFTRSLFNTNEITFDELMDVIKNAPPSLSIANCQNINDESQLSYFSKNKSDIEGLLSKYIDSGYSVSVKQSWQDPEDINPEFLVCLEKDGDVRYALVNFNLDPEKNDGSGSYDVIYIKIACPEFWARLEKDLES